MASKPGDPRLSYRWQRIRTDVVRAARAAGAPCSECGQPIDYGLSGRDPRGPHVDHGYAVIDHPGLALSGVDLRPTHGGCNVSRSNRARARKVSLTKIRTSQAW